MRALAHEIAEQCTEPSANEAADGNDSHKDNASEEVAKLAGRIVFRQGDWIGHKVVAAV